MKKQKKTSELSFNAKVLINYFVRKLPTIPRMGSRYAKNMRVAKNLLAKYTLNECKVMVDQIFEDLFWKDKMDSMFPIISAPHKWLPPSKEEKIGRKKEDEIGQHVWYEIFNGDPFDCNGNTTENNAKEAVVRFVRGENLEDIYIDMKGRVRK